MMVVWISFTIYARYSFASICRSFERGSDGQLVLIDEIEDTHIGCEYGEYDHSEAYWGLSRKKGGDSTLFNYSSGSRFWGVSSKGHRTGQQQSNKQEKGLRSSAVKQSGTSKALYFKPFSALMCRRRLFLFVSKRRQLPSFNRSNYAHRWRLSSDSYVYHTTTARSPALGVYLLIQRLDSIKSLFQCIRKA